MRLKQIAHGPDNCTIVMDGKEENCWMTVPESLWTEVKQ